VMQFSFKICSSETSLEANWMFCWPCITVYQYNGTNVMYFSLNLLRIKGIYVFRALLAHPQEALYKRHLVCCFRIMSFGWNSNRGIGNWHCTHASYQVPFVQNLLRMGK
jgi:hypothetical protein